MLKLTVILSVLLGLVSTHAFAQHHSAAPSAPRISTPKASSPPASHNSGGSGFGGGGGSAHHESTGFGNATPKKETYTQKQPTDYSSHASRPTPTSHDTGVAKQPAPREANKPANTPSSNPGREARGNGNGTTQPKAAGQNKSEKQASNPTPARPRENNIPNRPHSSNPLAEKRMSDPNVKAIKENKTSYTMTKTNPQTGQTYKEVMNKQTGKIQSQHFETAHGSVSVYNKKDGGRPTVVNSQKDRAGHVTSVAVTKGNNGRTTITRERPVTRNGVNYSQRTTIINNKVVVRNYYDTGRYWGGVRMYGYSPGYYYNPGYYGYLGGYGAFGIGYAYSPFSYCGFWCQASWGFWEPLPVYPTPLAYMTDFVVADMIANAIDRHVEREEEEASEQQQIADANADAADANARAANTEAQMKLDKATQAKLQARIQSELQAQQDKKSLTLPDTLKVGVPFVIAADTQANDGAQGCQLSQGAVVEIANAVGDGSPMADVKIDFRKPNDCAMNATVKVSIEDLQKSNEAFSVTVDKAAKDVSEHKDKIKLPSNVDANGTSTIDPADVADAQSDAQAAANEAQAEADQAVAAAQKAQEDANAADAAAGRGAAEPSGNDCAKTNSCGNTKWYQ